MSPNHSRGTKKLPLGTKGLLLLISLALLYLMAPVLLNWMNRFELLSFEDRQSMIHENRTHSGISIVEIDETTLNDMEIKKHFGRYPWRREIYGYLFRFFKR